MLNNLKYILLEAWVCVRVCLRARIYMYVLVFTCMVNAVYLVLKQKKWQSLGLVLIVEQLPDFVVDVVVVRARARTHTHTHILKTRY